MTTAGNINAGMAGRAVRASVARVAAGYHLPLPLHSLPLPYRGGQRADVALGKGIDGVIL